MAPQDDLTAERADLKEIARKLVLQINEITPVQWDKHDDKDQAIIIAALKTARQEALREGAKVAREFPWEQPSAHADPLRQARCRGNREASSDIAAALDRLASEGG